MNPWSFFFIGYVFSQPLFKIQIKNAQNRNRTSDTRIFSPLLYQLSYLGRNTEFSEIRALLYMELSEFVNLFLKNSLLETILTKAGGKKIMIA